MDEIERWKFEVRQSMLGYASAEKRGDSAAIEATSARACELVDELAAKISAERERCAKLCDEAKAAVWPYHYPEVRKTAEAVCENLAARIRGTGA